MSPQPSKVERNDAQLKRSARSSQNQQTSSFSTKGSEAGSAPASHASSGRSGKRSNGQHRGSYTQPTQPNPNFRSQHEGHGQRQQAGATMGSFESNASNKGYTGANIQGKHQGGVGLPAKQSSVPPKSNGLLPKPPIPQSSEKSSTIVPGESLKDHIAPIQFGSFHSDNRVPFHPEASGLQVPARTSSAPPNICEQKQDQARFVGSNETYASKASIPSAGQHETYAAKASNPLAGGQHKHEDHLTRKLDASKSEVLAEEKKSLHFERPSVSTVMHTQSPHMQLVHQPPPSQQISTSFPSMPSQPQQFGSQSLMSNALQSQSMMAPINQHQMYAYPSALQGGIVAHVPGLPYSQSLHHITPQANTSTSHILSPQFPINYPRNPQLAGMPSHVTSYSSSQANPLLNSRPNPPVKITRPDTHEEIQLVGTSKSDSLTDSSSSTVPATAKRLAETAVTQGNTVEVSVSDPHKKNQVVDNGPLQGSNQPAKKVTVMVPESSVTQAKEKPDLKKIPDIPGSGSATSSEIVGNRAQHGITGTKDSKPLAAVERTGSTALASEPSVMHKSEPVQQPSLNRADSFSKSSKPEQKPKKKHKQQQAPLLDSNVNVSAEPKTEAVQAKLAIRTDKPSIGQISSSSSVTVPIQKSTKVSSSEIGKASDMNSHTFTQAVSDSDIGLSPRNSSGHMLVHNEDPTPGNLGIPLQDYKASDQKASTGSDRNVRDSEEMTSSTIHSEEPQPSAKVAECTRSTSFKDKVLKGRPSDARELSLTSDSSAANDQLSIAKLDSLPGDVKSPISFSVNRANAAGAEDAKKVDDQKHPKKLLEKVAESTETEKKLVKADGSEIVTDELNPAIDSSSLDDTCLLPVSGVKGEIKPLQRNKSKGKEPSKAGGDSSTSNEKDAEDAQMPGSKVAVVVNPSPSLQLPSPCDMESKTDITARATEKDKTPSSPAKGVEAVKPGKKKKTKEFLKKADAAGSTGDLYNAYKVVVEPPPEPCKVEPTVSKIEPIPEVELQKPKEVDDWEDDAELLTAVNEVAKTNLKSSGDRKYSRDFLMTLKDQCRELPAQFEMPSDVMEVLVNPHLLLKEGELLPNGRTLDRQASGNHRLERRQSNISVGDDDRWVKPPDSFSSIRDGPSRAFQGSQSFNSAFGRNVRTSTSNFGGILQGSSSVQPYGQNISIRDVPARGSDAEKWQRAPSMKGLIPSPHSSLPAIHKTENPYELRKSVDQENLKQRQIKSILNKLTPQNFEKLFVKVQEVNIDSADCLQGVISQIFDKALMEPTFCEMYAKFCVRLANGLPEFLLNNERVVFKRVLLNKCQEEFERDEREQEEANKDGDGEKTFSEEEKAEKRAAARRRMLGNIRFIGELYKESMLTERIMHACIRKLLGEFENPDEENVEALCKLMSTIGHMIDHKKAKDHIDAYFDRMVSMSDNQHLPARLRFMLKDVIDLRRNGWQQRRKVEGPKKIEEVHRDAVQEMQGMRSRGSGMGRRIMTPPDHGSRTPVGPAYSSQRLGDRGGQSSIGMRGFSSQDARVTERVHFDVRSHPNPLPARSLDEGQITLGPQGGLGRGMAGRGQSVTTNRNLGSDKQREVVGPMASGNLVDRMPSNLRDGSLTRNYSTEKPLLSSRSLLDRDGRELRSSKASSAEFTQERPSQRLPSPQLSEEKLKQKSEMAIKEFYSVGDLKEVALCVEDLKAPSFHPTMLSIWISNSFERKEKERDDLARLLTHLCHTPSPVNKSHLLKGLEMVFSMLEDATCDAPKAPEFLGNILGKLVLDNVLSIQEIIKAMEGIQSEDDGAFNVLCTIFQAIKINKGNEQLNEMYRKSGVKLETFLPPGWKHVDVERFLQKKDIQCLYQAGFTRHL